MIIMLFDLYERRLRDIDTVESCIHTDNADENTCSISAYGVPDEAEYAAFKDVDGNFQLFFIASREKDTITGNQVLYCENAMYELATDPPLADVRPTNVQAGAAVTMALSGTRWQLGTTIETAQKSARWFYVTPHAALQSVVETWGVYLRPRITVSGATITGRYIDVVSPTPVWRGKRFEIGKDVLTSKFTIDKRNVATAIVPRGKGEESGDGYTTRLDISEVAWSIAGGDPADKPIGQTYIEKPDATALYGIAGTRPRIAVKVYEDITDANELLQAAWDDLQSASVPVLSGNVTAFDLERVGFPHEAARFNDSVAFISDGLRYTSTIVGIKREYAQNGRDVFTFGALSESNIRQLYGIQRTLNTVSDKANAGAQIAQHNPDLLRGIIDTAVTQILSTVTKRYTDTDGGDVYETADGTKAVKLTGAGILCASSKVGDTWQWQTAIDGSGIVANMITSGVLQASLVRILGTDRFYWDSSNITIIDTTDANKQIRIGLYDGTHYGIGFTTDGGETWQNAIGFSGLTIQAGSVTQDMLDPDIPLGTVIYWLDTGGYSCVVLDANGAYNPNVLYFHAYQREGTGSAQAFIGRLSFTCYYTDGTSDTGVWNVDNSSWTLNISSWMGQPTRTGKTLDRMVFHLHEPGGTVTEIATAAINIVKDGTDGSGLHTYCQDEAPTEDLTEGDLWVDTNDNNKMYRYDGTEWQVIQDTHLDAIVISQGTRISANETAISLKAQQTTVDALTGRVSTAEASIVTQAGQIASKVSAGDIASAINQTAQAVLISASKIGLSGYVTINSLKSGGTTVVDGGRITTGLIAAARIDVNNLYVKHLNGADGSFSGTLNAVNGTFTGQLIAAWGTFKGTLTCADNPNYSLSIGTVDGYSQPSLYPNVAGTGNVGTRTHYFDYMFADRFTDPSSLKIKKNIRDLTDDDYDLFALRPITYELKAKDTGERNIGFIAEEINVSCPMLAIRGEDDGEPYAIEYTRFGVIAIREIQKLWGVIKDLRAEIAALKSQQNQGGTA